MSFNIYYFSTAISIGFLVLILEMVRSKKLKEQYSLLWIFISIIMVVISTRHQIVEQLAQSLGVYYAPAILFLFGLIFCFTLILHFMIIISKYNSQYVRTVQEVALLKQQVKKLEDRLKEKEKKRGA